MGTEKNPDGQLFSVSQGDTDADTRTLLDEIHGAFTRRLADLGSVVLDDPVLSGEIFEEVDAILREVLGIHSSEAFSPTVFRTGRARREIHPVASLQAAGELFDVALPIISRNREYASAEIIGLSLRLHRSVMNRIALTALPYVEFLLTKIHSASKRERLRISRDLHDGAAHEIVVGLQHMDMYRYFSGTDSMRAEREFEAGLASLNEALRAVQALSTELRMAVGENGIKEAIESYLGTNVPDVIRTELSFTGTEELLPPPISEELFLIIRECPFTGCRELLSADCGERR